eukprot:5274711-Lingulodinium_polyedra.AAC.1
MGVARHCCRAQISASLMGYVGFKIPECLRNQRSEGLSYDLLRGALVADDLLELAALEERDVVVKRLVAR